MELAKKIELDVLQALECSQEIGESGISTDSKNKVYNLKGVVSPMKSMIEPYEVALLYIMAKNHYGGLGHIIDAGPLFGLSTQALCAGIRQNSREIKIQLPVQSFDLFEVNPPYDQFVSGFHKFGPTSNALYTFLKFNAGNLDLVSPHQGDFLNWNWSAESPIEIIFNDLSKTIDLNNKMFNDYISNLIPGEGFLIQQDYVHFAQWWVAASMEYFHEDFDELGYYFGGTKLFKLKDSGCHDAKAFNLNDMTFESVERLLIRAIERAPVTVKEALQTALGMYYIDSGKYDLALETVLPMKLDESVMADLISAPVQAHENFALILPSCRRRIIQYANAKEPTPGSSWKVLPKSD
jgi:hypothetical protein